jgi:hypothetical protein
LIIAVKVGNHETSKFDQINLINADGVVSLSISREESKRLKIHAVKSEGDWKLPKLLKVEIIEEIQLLILELFL